MPPVALKPYPSEGDMVMLELVIANGEVDVVSVTGRLTVSRGSIPVPAASSIEIPTCNGVVALNVELGVPVIKPVLDNDNPSALQTLGLTSWNPINEAGGGLPVDESAS